ncbi:MAG: hypothetical protein ACTHQM_25605 [Thermoanaerobaculia bacterium]
MHTDLLSSDPSALAWCAPASPSIIKYILELASERNDVQDEITASQVKDGIRQIFLEATRDYFVTPSREIASMQGTKTHNLINKNEPGMFFSETRLFYRVAGRVISSAKNDTYHVPTRLLEDLKNVKWYAIRLLIERGPLAAFPGYVYQLNLYRVLMKQPENQALLISRYPWLADFENAFTVRRMQLLCTPPDMDARNRHEAAKVIDTHSHIPIAIPLLDDDALLRAYTQKFEEKVRAIEADYAPLCTPEEQWQKESGYPLKCAKFCDVADHCRALSAAHGETHPLDTWTAIENRKAAARTANDRPTRSRRKSAA